MAAVPARYPDRVTRLHEVETGGAGRWRVVRGVGTVQQLHGREPDAERTPEVLVAAATDSAVVLGSSQSPDDVDLEACNSLGLSLVKRRTGGGAVLVGPNMQCWVDVTIGRNDPHWTDDVGESPMWLGLVWQRALAGLGVATELHHPPMVTSRLSNLVCFAGRGPGELSIVGSKVMGVSQRRSSGFARFQCLVPTRWDPGPLVEVLTGLSDYDMAELSATATAVDVEAARLEAAFLENLAEV